jgi:hypothetical protein
MFGVIQNNVEINGRPTDPPICSSTLNEFRGHKPQHIKEGSVGRDNYSLLIQFNNAVGCVTKEGLKLGTIEVPLAVITKSD